MTYILHAGILDNWSNPPAKAINLAAQALPIKAVKFGAIRCILLSIYSINFLIKDLLRNYKKNRNILHHVVIHPIPRLHHMHLKLFGVHLC
jgi:hypothetical protein